MDGKNRKKNTHIQWFRISDSRMLIVIESSCSLARSQIHLAVLILLSNCWYCIVVNVFCSGDSVCYRSIRTTRSGPCRHSIDIDVNKFIWIWCDCNAIGWHTISGCALFCRARFHHSFSKKYANEWENGKWINCYATEAAAAAATTILSQRGMRVSSEEH